MGVGVRRYSGGTVVGCRLAVYTCVSIVGFRVSTFLFAFTRLSSGTGIPRADGLSAFSDNWKTQNALDDSTLALPSRVSNSRLVHIHRDSILKTLRILKCSHDLNKKADMKFMKIGTRPDTFFTKEATRSIPLEVSSDLIIQVNNTKYLLHKFPLLPKCGLLQQLCESTNSDDEMIDLHGVPAEEEAFELCAKFCYGISINISARNIVKALCAAHFLQMSEAVEKGNFISKLELLFSSFILQAWKDPIVTLQSTMALPTWSENLNITGRCIDAIAGKILTDLANVTWSYTYTRPGFNEKTHKRAPRDWWTEDIVDLDVLLYRQVLSKIRSLIQPALVGEALHVYAYHHLPNESATESTQSVGKRRQVLEFVVANIPTQKGSVSTGFLLRLLRQASQLGVSDWAVSEIMRRAGRQLEDAKVIDLIKLRGSSSSSSFHDIDMVRTMLEHFLVEHRMPARPESNLKQSDDNRSHQSMMKLGKLIDSYLLEVAHDENLPVSKLINLAEMLPENARPDHDGLYGVIDIYLKKHHDLQKTQKKRLCQILDCRKLSTNACMHAVQNENLPLRTVVQVLFLEHARMAMSTSQNSLELRQGIKAMRPVQQEDMSRSMPVTDKGKNLLTERVLMATGRKSEQVQRPKDVSISRDDHRRDKRTPRASEKLAIREGMYVGKTGEIREEDNSKSMIRSKAVPPVTSEIVEDDSTTKMKPKGMTSNQQRTTKVVLKTLNNRGN